MGDRMLDGRSRWQAAEEAAQGLIAMLSTEAAAFQTKPLLDLVTFDNLVESIAAATDDYRQIQTVISATAPRNGTNITDALKASIQRLSAPIYRSLERSIVLMSDGSHNATPVPPTDPSVLSAAKSAGVKIYCIGVGSGGASDYDENAMRRIASETGGAFYPASDAYELSNEFLVARHKSLGMSLLQQHGTLTTTSPVKVGEFDPSQPPKQTASRYGMAFAQVPAGSSSLLCTLNYNKGSVALDLRDPSGQTVAPNYPGAAVTVGQPTIAIVKNPAAGTDC